MAKIWNRQGARQRWRISVSGTVQGVGFRPFVYKLAGKLGLSGWVCNTGSGVLIEAEGDEDALREFTKSLRFDAPELASISGLGTTNVPTLGDDKFSIRGSLDGSEIQPNVPTDTAACTDCLADIVSETNRRHGYPFTNCTNCGPRFTIIRRIPYDRWKTTMSAFHMCDECLAEYEDPLDRRFHAQPNACPACGPHLTLDGEDSGDVEAISETARLLTEGKIVAIKGLGGFHLACDARNSQSLRALRERKGRAGKPFALMCVDLDEVRRICEVDRASETLLLSPERPIVLMTARLDGGISPLAAQAIKSLGVMLPYTPLHHLLLSKSPPTLVMTSGNISEEPIAYLDDEGPARLGHLADHILTHDRPIYMACDDSVARVIGGKAMIIRRARGYVPRPIDIDMDMPSVLACGGDLKSAFCLTKGNLALMSQHLGDLENAMTLDHYSQTIEHFRRFFDVEPEIVAHDLHPDYHSTKYALSRSGRKIAVQHHHAHIASCMADNRLSRRVIGVAFDGTGYGSDGAFWGGEFLIADYLEFERAAHLAYVHMPGGEAAVRRPGRMALAYLSMAGIDFPVALSAAEVSAVKAQMERRFNSPLTSSMGRLFDAVSAMLGICVEVTYEGQAAIELEGVAFGVTDQTYSWDVVPSSPIQVDVGPMIREIVYDIRHGIPVGMISSRFHSTIADIVVRVCRILRDVSSLNEVALSGGVFQNALLLEMVVKRLDEQGFSVFRHAQVPCNDGGISLGQAVVAGRRCSL